METQKCVETSSEEILREQKQIRREQFFSNRALVIGLVIFTVIVLAAVFIPMVTGVDPNAMDVVNRLKPPSAAHIFGISLMSANRLSIYLSKASSCG